MKIERLIAKNYKTILDLDIEFPDYYCAISGKNNSGKTNFVSVIRNFLEEEDRGFLPVFKKSGHSELLSKFSKNEDEVTLTAYIRISKKFDSEVFFVVDKFSAEKIEEDSVLLKAEKIVSSTETKTICSFNDFEFDSQSSAEILNKIRTANDFIVYNSTSPSKSYQFTGGEFKEMLNVFFTDEDRKNIELEGDKYRKRLRTIVRKHKEQFTEILGRLSDNYEVDLAPGDSLYGQTFPIGITLNDKSVEIALPEWGSGTQNRVQILLSVLQASRLKNSQNQKNTTAPVVLIEEPESFLHPSAQAEFGRVLQGLAEDLKIQIICTTHSPYLLNLSNPDSNVLLERRSAYGKYKDTIKVDTSGDNWMRPFSDQLGIIPQEFEGIKGIVFSDSKRVILVEGKLDLEYFKLFKENFPNIYGIDKDIEVVSYGGKDCIRNVPLLKFALSGYKDFLITFDLDALNVHQKSLQSMGYEKNKDFLAIGIDRAGARCIEGLVPQHLKAIVYEKNPDLVEAMGSGEKAERESARNRLKSELLDIMKREKLADDELKSFKRMFDSIKKTFKKVS